MVSGDELKAGLKVEVSVEWNVGRKAGYLQDFDFSLLFILNEIWVEFPCI